MARITKSVDVNISIRDIENVLEQQFAHVAEMEAFYSINPTRGKTATAKAKFEAMKKCLFHYREYMHLVNLSLESEEK